MMGHTDKATINERRPLTDNMRMLLVSVKHRSDNPRSVQKCLFPGEMSQAEKNAAKALAVRGMLIWNSALLGWSITSAGRAALPPQNRPDGAK